MNELLDSPPEWVVTIPWGWIAALLLVIVGYLAYRVLVHKIGDQVADAERRHRYRKRVGYAVGAMVLVALIVLFIDRIRELGTLLGVVGAGVAIALREYLASVLAWFYILSQRNISLGSRIEIGSARGDVIDIGLFKLTLVEVRGEGLGGQSSGRLVTVPNYKVLIDPVYLFSSGAPYVWDEMDFLVTHESDWEQARDLIERIGREVTAPHRAEVDSGFRRLGDRYAFRPGITTPIVYVSIAESGIDLKLRYLTHVRQRRTSRDEISRRVLRLFRERPEIEFAYPTSRSFRREIDAVRPEDQGREDRTTPT